ncbi:hypothetical protein BDV3_005696 [Batrachochytrium dendrobatidis]|uniref:Uncharacterized protein n=1 Tax=Batrachochytrium dendrobatidis (strain JEL423) TaxID=403673 RepID=A0A177WIS6_BATDL|nr:hypothetical protein O5D80_003805 [Batrachochytrium dendrobatidis]KAK5666986.1 hypothetical protein QVD99_006207 [Batrachochytrium dendrobatidis]OAJ39983.1 hypothetical protein BDEG_23770 [Batrachochytrium dendrobatidis JEL423]
MSIFSTEGDQHLADTVQYYISMASIVLILPSFLYCCWTIASTPPPSRTCGPCWNKYIITAQQAELKALAAGAGFPEASRAGVIAAKQAAARDAAAAKEAAAAKSAAKEAAINSPPSTGPTMSTDTDAPYYPIKEKTPPSALPFSQQVIRRCIFVLTPNGIIWFLNLAGLIALLVMCVVSLAHWSIAFNNDFDIKKSTADWNSLELVEVIRILQTVSQSVYFLISVWMKHRLVRSLPGAASLFVVWATSIFICIVAVAPNIPSMFNPSLARRRYATVATLLLGFCMTIMAWIYVLLCVKNIKAASLSVTNTLCIIRDNVVLNRWLILRPFVMLIIFLIPLLLLIIRRTALELSGYIALVIISDFLFEYQQIQRGLFAMLVREISLPENVRIKLDQALQANSQTNEADWGDGLNDDPRDFEVSIYEGSDTCIPNHHIVRVSGGTSEYNPYDFGSDGDEKLIDTRNASGGNSGDSHTHRSAVGRGGIDVFINGRQSDVGSSIIEYSPPSDAHYSMDLPHPTGSKKFKL